MDHERPPVSRPSLTLSEAAAACGVSRSTIRRKHETGAFPSAWKDSEGAWRVPVEDLLGAGLRPGRPSPPDALSGPNEQAPSTTVTVPLSEWDALRQRAADAERLAEVAQVRVIDLDRALVTAERALLMLGSTALAGGRTPHPDEGRADISPPRPSRWRRRRA